MNNNMTTLFYETCLHNKINTFIYMKQYNPNIDIVDKEGNTCLHIVIRLEYLKLESELLKMKANCTIINNNKETPLMIACNKSTDEFALILLDSIVIDNTIECRKAFSFACRNSLIKVVEKLLKENISIIS